MEVKPNGHAIEISFDLVKGGFVVISKVLPPDALPETAGIRFSYQGRGKPSTVEVKLIYKVGTIFTVWLRHTSVTGGYGWVTREIPYDNFWCFAGTGNGPDKCPPSGEGNLRLEPEKVEKIEFAVSNKTHDPNNPDDSDPEDDLPGTGVVTIRDVQAVR
jgi:hypothetical protein